MTMNVFVFSYFEVPTKEERLNSFQEGWISSHYVDKLAVLRASLSHHDLTVLFDDLGFDFARMVVHQCLKCDFSTDYCISDFFYTGWAETISFAREAKRRRRPFVGFEKRTRRPVWANRFTFRESLVN